MRTKWAFSRSICSSNIPVVFSGCYLKMARSNKLQENYGLKRQSLFIAITGFWNSATWTKTTIILYIYSTCNATFTTIGKNMTKSHSTPEKIGWAHTTIIGWRHRKKLIYTILDHSEVKRRVPSVINVKGNAAASGGITGKVLRSDTRGNLRMIITHGTAVQEIRVITTVADDTEGERLMNELNAMLFDDKE